MSPFLIFCVCSFTSGYATRLADPIVLPVATAFGVTTALGALLVTAYGIPYAVAQPFLGPLGEKLGKERCIQWCIIGLALSLVAGAFAPTFGLLVACRVASGLFGAGLSPLIIASLGDRYEMAERQIMIGRLLFALIAGQMLGSAVSGIVADSFGWRGALGVAAIIGVLAAVVVKMGLKTGAPPTAAERAAQPTARAMYREIFRNPRSLWLFGAVSAEGMLFFGMFPYIGQVLVERTGALASETTGQAGLILGAFGMGGFVYAFLVRFFTTRLGLVRMAVIGGWVTAAMLVSLTLIHVWWMFAVALGITGVSYFLVHNPIQVQSTELSPTARGASVALFACSFFCGQGLGPIYFGALLHSVGSTTAFLVSAVGFAVLGHVVSRKVVH